jgi:hypothetical protein
LRWSATSDDNCLKNILHSGAIPPEELNTRGVNVPFSTFMTRSLYWRFFSDSLDLYDWEKKRQYNDRVMKVENGTFTPLVFSSSGGMAPECRMFFKQLSSLVADHRKETYSLVASWIKTKLSFSLLRSAIRCIRGTRNPYYKSMTTDTNDINFEVQSTSINDDW